MNNNAVKSPSDDGEEIRIKGFRSAQNKVAVMMFIMLFTEFAAGIVMLALTAVLPEIKNDMFKYELMQALMYLLYMAVPVFTFGLISGKAPAKYFTFRRGGKRAVAVGFAVMGAVYFAQLVAAAVADLLSGAGLDVSSGELAVTSDPAVIALRFVYLAAVPAVLEELMTRGLILGELLPYGKGFAIIASGAIFGLMHMNPVQLPFAFIAGTAMAFAVVYCQTLRVSVAVHFANNFLSVLFVTLSAFVPEHIVGYTEAAVTAAVFTAGAVSVIWLIRHKDGQRQSESGALCTEVNEPYKVDLRDGTLKKIAPLLYIYAASAIVITIISLITSSIL